ncbi:MAG: ABC transporter ATP-binding protein [Planctomycetes bacterium]|nr:ABC transporter ATP-binding protein [Planctomycetota bacterium]
MIEVQDLRKTYGDLVAVDGVSFRAPAGAIYGLLGPNGAGKSTTIGCLSGLVAPSAGRVSVCGHDVLSDGPAAKRALGVVPQELALYEDVSASDNLAYWGAAYGLRGAELKARVLEVLELVELADRAKEPVKGFSGGMKRRLNFGCGVVHRPAVLLLDEPTVGVDPQSRRKLLDLVRRFADEGACVLYTTHYMEEAEELCDRLAIVDHGKLLAEGTLAELRGELGERDLLRLSGRFEPEAARAALASFDGCEVVSAEPDALMLSMAGATRQLASLFGALDGAGAQVVETTLTQPNLESLFIKLTGRELRE